VRASAFFGVRSLGKQLVPLSGSLPEVLHHLDKIVGLLTTHLAGPWASGHDTALLLISVLAKVRSTSHGNIDVPPLVLKPLIHRPQHEL
jgi:hypothetical protein